MLHLDYFWGLIGEKDSNLLRAHQCRGLASDIEVCSCSVILISLRFQEGGLRLKLWFKLGLQTKVGIGFLYARAGILCDSIMDYLSLGFDAKLV